MAMASAAGPHSYSRCAKNGTPAIEARAGSPRGRSAPDSIADLSRLACGAAQPASASGATASAASSARRVNGPIE